MRGAIDLSGHKLAGLYRAPARKTRRSNCASALDPAYRQIWRIVDGAIRDTFENWGNQVGKYGEAA